MQTIVTIHSGGCCITLDVAAAGVLVLLGEGPPPEWLSPPSGVNYAVGMVGESARRIGVVHVGQGVGDGRVLGE